MHLDDLRRTPHDSALSSTVHTQHSRFLETGQKVLLTGAGRFIGSHLVDCLQDKGYRARGADIKYPEFATSSADQLKEQLEQQASAIA